MILRFHHAGRYEGRRFTIEDVIGSLSAQRELLRAAVAVLPELDPSFQVDDVAFVVETLATGSLEWDILVEVYGQYQELIEGVVVGGLERMTGMDIPPEYEALVTFLTLAVLYWVARYAYDRVARARGAREPSVHIEGEGNVVVQMIGQVVDQPAEVVRAALDRAVPPAKRRALIPRVADFLRPARKNDSAPIGLAGAPTVPSEAIREFPSDADLASVEDSANLDVEGALVDIRATDRDRTKVGWWALIVGDERFPRRLPMDLYPTVDAEALAAHRFVRANLIVECDRPPEGPLRPRRIHLFSWSPAGQADAG